MRPLILLVGPHRTLSSALGRVLERLGVYMGEAARGEDRELSWLCESLCPFPAFRTPADRGTIVGLFEAWLRRHLARAGDRTAGAKYPTLCLFLDELEEAAGRVGVELEPVECARRLPDSIRSLVTRSTGPEAGWSKATPREAACLQIELFKRKAAWLARRPHWRVIAERLLADPGEEIFNLAMHLACVAGRIDQGQVGAAAESIEKTKAPHTPAEAIGGDWQRQVTVLITAHERPECLHDCITSIRAFYPEIAIRVADDSAVPAPRFDCTYHGVPADGGVSAGRNFLVRKADTPYVVICDDDAVWTGHTRIERLLATLAAQQADVVAGVVVRPTSAAKTFAGDMAIEQRALVLRPAELNGEPRRVDTMDNFFVAKRKSLERCPWNDSLKMGEHLDWCLRAKHDSRLKIVVDPAVTVLDRNTRPSDRYQADRARAIDFHRQSLAPWSMRLGIDRLDNRIHPNSCFSIGDPK